MSLHFSSSVWVALAVLSVGAMTDAHAWGRVGHAVIASRAEAELTPAARKALAPLLATLGESSIADIASWADQRRNRQQGHWHYVNMPPDDCTYQRLRDCPGDQCLVEQVKMQVAILADLRNSDAVRANALIYVVHFAGGDSSQPLHMGMASDKGGNTYQIRVGNRGTNLHSFYDSGAIFSSLHTHNTDTAIARLEEELDHTAPPHRPAPTLQPEAWVNQACSIAHAQWFYPPHIVPADYTMRADGVIRRQLILGGDELAGVLNQALLGHDPMR